MLMLGGYGGLISVKLLKFLELLEENHFYKKAHGHFWIGYQKIPYQI